MANSTMDIPFYAANGGAALVGAAAEMEFEFLKTLAGIDKSAGAPAISEIGGGWYKFGVAYGSVPFDEGDLVGVIDADKDGVNGLTKTERFIPVEVRLDFYALGRLVNRMSQDKLTGDMLIKNELGDTVLKLGISESTQTMDRVPGAVS